MIFLSLDTKTTVERFLLVLQVDFREETTKEEAREAGFKCRIEGYNLVLFDWLCNITQVISQIVGSFSNSFLIHKLEEPDFSGLL